jgi:hypothetical protein
MTAHTAMREQFQDEHSKLNQVCEEFTESERCIGIFESIGDPRAPKAP